MQNKRAAWYLIPSSYGFVIWVLLLIAVNFTAVRLQSEAVVLLAYVPLCFAFSNFLNGSLFSKIDFKLLGGEIKFRRADKNLFFLSAILGFGGLFLYARDFGAELGGLAVFFYTFFDAPLEIRALAQDVRSSGFQISYFSWIFIFYCVYFWCFGLISRSSYKVLVVILAIVALFLNLMFIDRTRPITIFVVSALMVIFFRLDKIKRPSRLIFYLLVSPFLIFFAQAAFTQKYDLDEGIFANLIVYVFGGFGYFSALMFDVNPQFGLTRVFLPISKILEGLGVLQNVPSQILEFRNIPFPTNVGTFLEPLLSDGGPILVVIGAPLIIFFTDFVALRALSSKTIFGVIFWANLVLLVMLSFFVPKYNSTYLYFFAIIYILMLIFRGRLILRDK